MNISESNAKMKIGDKYYTLMQKDEESQFKFHFDGGYINLVTKDEVIANSPDVIYKDNVKGFYKANGTLIQLAFKENFDFPQHYELLFNSQEGFVRTDNIESDEHFTIAKVLNISRSINIIEYNNFNSDIIANDETKINRTDKLIMLTEKITTPTQHVIDFTTETEIIYKNLDIADETRGCHLHGSVMKPNQKILDFATETEITYENLDIADETKGCYLHNIIITPTRKTLDLRLEETCENITLTNTTRDDFKGGIMLGSEVEVND